MKDKRLHPNDLTHCQCTPLHTIAKGTQIYQQGEFAQAFYYVEDGLIGLYHTLGNGKESLVRLYQKGDYFGFRTLFGDSQYHCNAKVLINAEVIRIKPDNITQFFVNNIQAIQMLMQIIAHELRDAESRLAKIAYLKSLDRVIDSIYFLSENFPHYNWTHREIAEYAGCETETAIRIVRDLKRNHLLGDILANRKL